MLQLAWKEERGVGAHHISELILKKSNSNEKTLKFLRGKKKTI